MDQDNVEKTKPERVPHWRQVCGSLGITSEVEEWNYSGSGSEDDPYAVTWIDQDPRNPMIYGVLKRWFHVAMVSLAALMVSLDSSAYTGCAQEIQDEFGVSEEVFLLGISLFVLGFAIGPLLYVWIPTYAVLTALNAGAGAAKNIETLLILRFLAGAFGSYALISGAAVVADQFSTRDRGLAMAYFFLTPFLGPTLGPIIGGYTAQTLGWAWVIYLMALLSGGVFIVYIFTVPETFAPVILKRRAERLSKMTGNVYTTQLELKQGPKKLTTVLRIALSRPWILLATEPIVLVLSLYQSIIYATLYLCFAAFPIVFQEKRSWSPGEGGLAFLGVAVGMLFTLPYNIWNNSRYRKLLDRNKGSGVPPEARLPLCMAGAIAAPISLFWFAWTNSSSIHFMVPIVAGAPFGFGLVVIFQGINNYLVDSYLIFSASVLAGVATLRSVFAAVFPLFTTQMYHGLGIHWASTVPAFWALGFAPFPFLLYRYGPGMRAKCKYSAEATGLMKQLQS